MGRADAQNEAAGRMNRRYRRENKPCRREDTRPRYGAQTARYTADAMTIDVSLRKGDKTMKDKKFYETKAFRWLLAGLLAFVLVSSNVVDKMVRIYANEEGQVDQVDNSAAEEAARQAEEEARRAA